VPPSSVDGFDCYLVNVMGPGIAPYLPVFAGKYDWNAILSGSLSCNYYPGIASQLIPANQANTEVELLVPSGPQRLVQIMGTKVKNPAIGCDNAFYTANCVYGDPVSGTNQACMDAFEQHYEIGRTVVDLYSDRNVTISNSYDPVTPKLIACDGFQSVYNPPVPANPGINLEVPIEMVDFNLNSWMTPNDTIFTRSRTPLDTNDYDGSPTYFFEIVATLITPNSNKNVNLINSAGSVVATINFPTPTGVMTRRIVPFTPTPGADYYRVQVQATTASYYLPVHMARILVRQTGATRTRIYIPLLNHNTSLDDRQNEPNSVEQVSATSYTQGEVKNYGMWTKDLSQLASLAPGAPWSFDAVIRGSTGSDTAYATLVNRTASATPIPGTEVSTSNATETYVSASFSDAAPSFNNGDTFDVRIKNSGGGVTYLSKAGIWVKLTNLTKAQSYYRLSMQKTVTSVDQNVDQRTNLNKTYFSNPVFNMVSTGSTDCSPGNHYISLESHGTDDSGIASGLNHGTQALTSTVGQTWTNTGNIWDDYRYIASTYAGSCNLYLHNTMMIVNSSQ
jgi:hypothetical protein